MPEHCNQCGVELTGGYHHWLISGFPYCDICFELMLIVTSNQWMKHCHREYVREMAKRRRILRGNK